MTIHFVGVAARAVLRPAILALLLTATSQPSRHGGALAMTAEETRKLAADSGEHLAPPPRMIDDITRFLEQNRPDPKKISELRAAAEKAVPGGLGGMELADFYFKRGLAARDLGRAEQALADLREAWRLAKPTAMKPPNWPAFTRKPGTGPFAGRPFAADFEGERSGDGPGPRYLSRRGMGSVIAPSQEGSVLEPGFGRRRGGFGRFGAGGGPGGDGGQGGGFGSGGGFGPGGRGNFGPRGGGFAGGGFGPDGPRADFAMPHPVFHRASLAERVPPGQQHAFRIFQSYMVFETSIGEPRRAASVYEEVRPHLLITLPGFAIGVDSELAAIELRIGNIEGSRRWVARMQQLLAKLRGYPQNANYLNVWNGAIASRSGTIQLAIGKAADAEPLFRAGIRGMDLGAGDSKHWESDRPTPGTYENRAARVRLGLAQSLARQGKLIEAEIEARRALLDIVRLQSEAAPLTASAVLVFSDVLQAQGRYSDAQRIAEAALDIYERGGVEKVHHADALQRIAVGQAAQGQWQEALRTFDKIRQVVSGDLAVSRRYVDGNLDLALVLVRGNQAAAAVTILEGIVKQRVAQGQSDYALAVARGFLGTALSAAGRDEEALRILRDAVPVLIVGANEAGGEEGALDEQNRRQMIFDGYFEVLVRNRGTEVARRLGIDAIDEAFRLADVTHAKSVQRAIVASSLRAASGQAALADLIRSAQDADQRLAAANTLLRSTLESPDDAQTREAVQSLRGEVARVQTARETLRKAIEKQFPQYAQLVNPKPAGIAEARARLRDNEVLIVTYFNGGNGYVFAVRHQGDVGFARMTAGAADIEALVGKLRDAVDAPVATAADIPAFPVASAHALYDAVLGPVATTMNGADTVIVVPDAALGKIPFSLLVTRDVPQPQEGAGAPLFAGYRDVPFLIRDAAVSQIPSVVALSTLRSVPAGAAGRKPFIGFGDPVFSAEQARLAKAETEVREVAVRGGRLAMRAAADTSALEHAGLAQLPRLPDTAIEVRDIAKALGADPIADVLLGTKASEKTVRSMRLNDRKVVMFATHGLVPHELDGLVQPALALSAPDVPGVEGDGLLTVEKVLGLKLDADWIVLSACDTAAPEGGGTEAISGLGRAFFYAGARALLVTHWPVETVSARALTTNLFRRQAQSPEVSRADALRQAANDMITQMDVTDPATGEVAFTYAHPMFWAPFALVGDGGVAERKP